MPRVKVKIDGLRELGRALGQLPKSTAKAVLRKVLRDAAEPMAQKMRAGAPVDTHNLQESIDVSTQLSRRQRAMHRAEERPTFQEMFVGTNSPAGVQQEFGNENHVAQPFARPGWDAEKMPTLERIANSLWLRISEAAARLARRAARGR
jgi:HK97 gp10 family phage protein